MDYGFMVCDILQMLLLFLCVEVSSHLISSLFFIFLFLFFRPTVVGYSFKRQFEDCHVSL